MISEKTLPKFYLITPNFEGDFERYRHSLILSLKNGIHLIQLRSKNLSYSEYKSLAKKIIPLVHHYGGKIILNQIPSILDEVDADGIHLPSMSYEKMDTRPISNEYIFSVACHNKQQLEHAEALQTDIGVLCPVLKTPSSPQGKPIGWGNFKKLVKNINFPIYALGNVKPTDYQKALHYGAYGISAIRALWALNTPINCLIDIKK